MSRSSCPRARHSIGHRRCAALAILRYALGGGGKPMRYWGATILLLAAACQQQKPPAKAVQIAFDGAQVTNAAAKIAHGERLSWTLGCRGCHRGNLQGGSFYERYASNLTRELPRYNDAEI